MEENTNIKMSANAKKSMENVLAKTNANVKINHKRKKNIKKIMINV